MLKHVNINSCLPIKTANVICLSRKHYGVTFLMEPVRVHRTLLPEPWFHGKALIGRIALAVRNQYIRA